jgi:hypothetical protein
MRIGNIRSIVAQVHHQIDDVIVSKGTRIAPD